MGQLNLATVTVTVASILANAWLAPAYLSLRDQLATTKASVKSAEQQRDTAQLAALSCGNAVDDLHRLSTQRAQEAAAARDQSAAQASVAAKRADAILTAPAAVPGDDCQSAQVRVNAWLQTRTWP